MKFYEVVEQVTMLLQREGRISYRALKREFDLDEEFLEDLKEELIIAKRLASDEDGKVLVWVGASPVPSAEFQGLRSPYPQTGVSSQLPAFSASQPPALQTPNFELRTANVQPVNFLGAEAERRQLTVMFCDVVGSTALSEQLDPEELREVVRAYQAACTEVIERFDGHIAQYLGDGLLVYFGYPVAHEDDAQRAVRAGLGIVEAMRASSVPRTPSHNPLQVRIGIHTGLVVVGEVGGGNRREQLALGDTPNIAARLQGLAEPNTVVISTATHRLIQGYFDCRDLGLQSLKGVLAPLGVYQPLEETGAQSRFEMVARSGFTSLVGREEEMRMLLTHWEHVKAGEGYTVFLCGEAGLGKSRLVQELKEQVTREGYSRIEFRCSPYHQHTAFYPVIEHLQRLLQFRRDDSSEEKLAKLERTLQGYCLPLPEVVPLFAALLSLPPPEGYPPLTQTPQRQRRKTQEALWAWLLEEAERTPLLVVWEDLHWADPSTLELHTLFLGDTPTARICTVLTFRPEFRPPWGARSHLTQITLNRLSRPQVETLIGEMTGYKTLPMEVTEQIVNKTDGVPLFVEELTKMVLESGLLREEAGHYTLTAPLPPLAIPSTLQDSLMARLDRLATVREVAQLGAILGREFSYELLRAVAPWDEVTLQQGLAQLVNAELLYQRGLPPQARYFFKHALIQETAYYSVLKSKRQQYHQKTARVLEARFADVRETQPELLAYHYTEAGLPEPAIPYWRQAGQRAVQRSANLEAISHLTKGVDLLSTLPETPERAQQELLLLATLGVSLTVVKGHAAPEVEQLYTRARALCRQVGDTPQLSLVLWGLGAFYFVRGQTQTALELGEQLLSQGEGQTEAGPRMLGHYHLATVLLLRGRLVDAVQHFEQVLTIYDSRAHRQLAHVYGFDLSIPSHALLAWARWLLGYPERALRHEQAALTLARESGHPFSQAYARLLLAFLQVFRQDAAAAHAHATAGIDIATEQGFVLFAAYSMSTQGWAEAQLGQSTTGIATMQRGLDGAAATGAELLRAFFLTMLAHATGTAGQPEPGLRLLTEALQVMERTGERFYEAELYRLYGELLLLMGERETGRTREEEKIAHSPIHPLAYSSPEECFQKAIDLARQQQAKSLELRATMSLARLWQRQGKQRAAHSMLLEIYQWFTEGLDTADLNEAKTLLEKLTG